MDESETLGRLSKKLSTIWSLRYCRGTLVQDTHAADPVNGETWF